MTPVEFAKQDIRRMVAHSCVPEDPTHAENTLQWVLKLDPVADDALQIAALAHDIDRASSNKVQRSDFDEYDDFKAAHAKNSAEILRQILEKHDCPTAMIKKASHLVEHHEVGGDRDSDLLKDADSIAYFDYNLPFYFKREGWTETMQRCRWGYERLSPKMKTVLGTIQHNDPEINRLLGEMIDSYKGLSSNTDLLLVGHYTHDILVNKDDNTSVQCLGGGVTYASVVATALKQKFKVVSKVGHDFYYDAQCQQSPRVVAHNKTTCFTNYTNELPRRHRVSACCEPIYPNDIKESSHIALVCGVIGEVLPETIQKLREETVILMGDIQGFIRQVDPSGDVHHVHLDATPYKDVVPLFDYLKVSDEELPYINVSALRKTTLLLVTHGDDGCTVYQKEHQFHIPACAVTPVDSTGAGDSFLTGFAIGILKKLSLKQAIFLGCCCGHVAVQSIGAPKVVTFDNNMYLCDKFL